MSKPEGSIDFMEQPKTGVTEPLELAGTTDMDLEAMLEKSLNPSTQPETPEIEPEPQPEPETPIESKVEAEPDKAPEAPVEKPAEIDNNQSVESLKKQLANLQALYGRQSNELGQLRAKLKAKPTQEQFDEDPVKATEELQEHNKTTEKIQQLEQEQKTVELVTQNMEYAKSYSPDLESNAQTIYNLLVSEDGIPPTEAQQFMGQIYLANPLAVYHLNQRARAVKAVQTLRAEIEKLKAEPKKVVQKIAEINKAVPSVTSSTGQSSVPTGVGIPFSESELAQMPTADLEAALKANLSKER